MRRGRWNPWARWIMAAAAGVLLLSGCGDEPTVLERSGGIAAASADDVASSTTTEPPAPAVPVESSAEPAPVTYPPAERTAPTAFSPFATVGGVTLHHPAARIERLGFHESNHDGARQMETAPTAVRPMTLPTRERGTGSRTAADIVVPPDEEIRSPVTGTVLRAGGYVLYCDHDDDFAVIEPDAHPGWEVKILHIDGVQLRAGDRVEAGVTVVAPRPTPLPFESQVDEFTTQPAWPHVHIEVVDPTIPDRPSPGGGCN